ncbi:MAG: hypothetical protein M1838_000301 [Thelocarpon superellum]|nr:MAG: hypothetical protein M1838_000301 [Thelocarpon superellum]
MVTVWRQDMSAQADQAKQRKVKCSEERPSCAQCARLNHTCDYNPRLAFRDDTPRILGGFRSFRRVSTEGNVVWDPQSPSRESSRARSVEEDDLPPFSELTNDEERERKAENHEPGTFHVVVNPESFATLPEYNEDEAGPGPSTTETRTEARAARESSLDSPLADTDDPHVIILRHFEEPARRGSQAPARPVAADSPQSTESSPPRESPPPVSPPRASPPPSPPPQFAPAPDPAELARLPIPVKIEEVDPALAAEFEPELEPDLESEPDLLPREDPDARLRAHYRQRLSSQMFWERDGRSGPDIFQRSAVRFPPLYHSMLALSSLSLDHREGNRSVDALQHYQQALPSLNDSVRHQHDLSSDGFLFTHFFLLLYEIGAAQQGASTLWSVHLMRLTDIVVARHDILRHEPHPFLLLFVAMIDTHAALCQCGDGRFVEIVVKNNLIPTVPDHAATTPDPSRPPGAASDAPDLYRPFLQFHLHLLLLTSRLGLLSRDFRRYARQHLSPPDPARVNVEYVVGERLRQATEIREALRRLWVAGVPASVRLAAARGIHTLPDQTRHLFEQSWALYCACLIYSHCSMWSSQWIEATPDERTEVNHCINNILHIAREYAQPPRTRQLRFILLPIFLAGFASVEPAQKREALDAIRAFERVSLTPSALTILQLLELVYIQQEQSIMELGDAAHVDWVEVMVENGLIVVNFGL